MPLLAILSNVFFLFVAMNGTAHAQTKTPKAPSGPEIRYFTSIDGLMDGKADVILKELRQGKTVQSATLDVCYPIDATTDRKDRFIATLTAANGVLTGASASQIEKQPITVKLTQKPNGDSFEFRGQLTIGPSTVDVASPDNGDLSEKEYQEVQATDDGIVQKPKDFSEVSAEALAVKIRIDAVVDYLKNLRGTAVEISPNSLSISCDSLRSGLTTVYLTADPLRAASVIEQARGTAGVVSAGWLGGLMEMDRSIRFSAAEWRDGDRLNRDKIANALGDVLATTFRATREQAEWSDATGKLKLTFRRPSQVFPTLGLVEKMEVTALVAPERPESKERLILWASGATITTIDESSGPKLVFGEPPAGDEDVESRSESSAVDALARQFKGQRWDADATAWK